MGDKLVKIPSGEKCFGCSCQLDKRPEVSFCKRLLLSTYILLTVNIEIFKAVMLPVVLCGCETWSLTFSEERTIRVFEKGVLRGIFVSNKNEVNGSGENYRHYSLRYHCCAFA
jgi:hypothetical protein